MFRSHTIRIPLLKIHSIYVICVHIKISPFDKKHAIEIFNYFVVALLNTKWTA